MRTEGAVTFPDLQAFLTDMRARSATSYRKLLDAREGHLVLSEDELASYERQSIECAVYDRLGPYAIVATEASKQAHAALLTLLLSNTRRPSGLFSSPTDAYEWLLTQAVPGKL
ncbi:MAG TPA: hypothetical protein VMI56_00080 [Reyranella sp.]|nr:hypothetical protein [Reyranella sp.]